MDDKAEPGTERLHAVSEYDDIARETLRLLAVRRLEPTPDNYRRVYREVACTPKQDGEPNVHALPSGMALPRENREPALRHALEGLKELVVRLLAAYSEQVRRAEDPVELERLLALLMEGLPGEATGTPLDSDATRDRRSEAAETRIRRLEVELAQVREKVREDELTGMLNRRGLDAAFAREAARAARHGMPLSLALLDIDDFKRVNDAHGHQAGDAALAHLSLVIRETVRPEDVVARFGGEEFIVLLPNAGVDEAMDVMLRLQGALARRPFVHHGDPVSITFSSGIAEQLSGEGKEAFIERADRALYRAKKAGKNRVFAASE